MSIKVSKLYNDLHGCYHNIGNNRGFHSAIMEVVLDQKAMNVRYFVIEPTEFCRITVFHHNIVINIDGIEIDHGVGVHEPDLLPVLLKGICCNLRQARCIESGNMEKWIGKPLLTAMVNAGYIEQTVSWKLKL